MIFGGFIMKDKKSRILIYVLSAACAVLLCTVMILAVSLIRNAGTGSEAVSSHAGQQEVYTPENPVGAADTQSTPEDPVMVLPKEPAAQEEASGDDAASGGVLKDDAAKDDVLKDDAPKEDPEGPQRILFIGDSRTIDMFADSDDELSAFDSGDGIMVSAKHGGKFAYMAEAVARYGVDKFDVLVTCMGANDNGDFQNYNLYYDGLLAAGKKIIVCTVGPTEDGNLSDDDSRYYTNDKVENFNRSLVAWAEKNDIEVIDVYGFVSDSQSIKIDPADGIHYLPRPTTELWDFIAENINERVTGDGSV